MLAGFGRGDPDAGAAFVRRFRRRVYGLAKTIVGDPTEAEDIAQEALTRAWRHTKAYDPRRGSVATWVLTITRNLAVDAIRRRRSEPLESSAEALLERLTFVPPPEEEVMIDDDLAPVRAGLAQLPVEQRRAVVLGAFYGRTAQEIAESEAVPLGTAKTRIRAGLLKLRASIGTDQPAGVSATSSAGPP